MFEKISAIGISRPLNTKFSHSKNVVTVLTKEICKTGLRSLPVTVHATVKISFSFGLSLVDMKLDYLKMVV